MDKRILCVFFMVSVTAVWGYSGGAPVDVCDDMTPKHSVDPQKSKFPYTVKVSNGQIKAGDKVQITVGDGTPFKGFLLQVRDGNKAVGSFNVGANDKYTKAIGCHGSKQSAVTHKNSADKKSVTVDWTAPSNFKGSLQVYATVAENGGVFWVRNPTAAISVQ